MDRRERLTMEMEDRWSPAFEKMGSITDRLKKSYEKFASALGVTQMGVMVFGKSIGGVVAKMATFLSKTTGLAFVVGVLFEGFKGFAEGIKRSIGIIGAGVGLVVSTFKALSPVIMGVTGALVGFGGVADRAFDWIKNNPASRFFVNLAKDLVNVQMQTEVLKNRMITVFGSFDEGMKAFKRFTEVAAETPYLIEQVVSAVATLGAFGIAVTDLKLMEKYLKAIGDTAAATGKDINDIAYAFANATTGNMRGLKTVGITTAMITRKLGHEIDTITEYGREELAGAVADLMTGPDGISGKFGGGMARMMKWTMTGLLSNIRDFVGQTKRLMGTDLGSVVLHGMQGVTDSIKVLKDSGAWVEISKGVGYAFAMVGESIRSTIIPYLNQVGVAVRGVIADPRWKAFWNSISAVVRTIADVYMKSLLDKIRRIPALLGMAIPFFQKMPVYIGFLYEKFKSLKDMMFGWLQGLTGGIGKISFESIIKGIAKVTGWLFRSLEYWHDFKAIIKGVAAAFASFLYATGPLGALVGMLTQYLLLSSAAKDVGMAAGFREGAKAVESLASGFRTFIQYVQDSVNGLIGMGRTMKYVASIMNWMSAIRLPSMGGRTGMQGRIYRDLLLKESAAKVAEKRARLAELTSNEAKMRKHPMLYSNELKEIRDLTRWQLDYNDAVAHQNDAPIDPIKDAANAYRDMEKAATMAGVAGTINLVDSYDSLLNKVTNVKPGVVTVMEQIGEESGTAIARSMTSEQVFSAVEKFRDHAIQAQRDASVSTVDAEAKYVMILEKAHKQVADITTEYKAQAALLNIKAGVYQSRAKSESELYTIASQQVYAIEGQQKAIEDEARAYKTLHEVQEGGLTLENRTHLLELSGQEWQLEQGKVTALAAQRDIRLEAISQESAVQEELVSRYGDEARYMGAKSAALSNIVGLEQQRLSTIQNILKYENLSMEERAKYNLLLEQSKSKIKANNDLLRGNREEDWVASILGSARGIESVAPTMGSMKYITARSETPRTAVLTVAVEDRRDLQTVLQEKVLPMLDRKLYDESGTDTTNYGPYR